MGAAILVMALMVRAAVIQKVSVLEFTLKDYKVIAPTVDHKSKLYSTHLLALLSLSITASNKLSIKTFQPEPLISSKLIRWAPPVAILHCSFSPNMHLLSVFHVCRSLFCQPLLAFAMTCNGVCHCHFLQWIFGFPQGTTINHQ